MYRAGITAECNLVGAIHKLTDTLTIGDAGAVLGQWGCNRHIVDLLETAAALALQGAGSGDKDHRRALAPGFHHGRHGVGKTFRANKAHRGLTGNAGMAVCQVPRNLLMWAVNDTDAALGQTLQRRITKPPT